jgi:serine/threonine protein phosphatase PrpC
LLLIIGTNYWVANLGDSRAILLSHSSPNQWDSKSLSIDQKPDEPGEMKRILESNGRVEPYRDQNGEQLGPFRVWLKDE